MAQRIINNTRIKTKRDTATNWEAKNPILLNGEEIIVDTNAGEVRKKIGDGEKSYTQLPFTDEILRGLINNKVEKVTGMGLSTNDYTTSEKDKLANIADNANNYVHPTSHAATMITEDDTHRFITDEERTKWNAKASTAVVTQTDNGLMIASDKVKLDNIEENANNYTHPATHAASMITEDTAHRFITDEERIKWNSTAGIDVVTATSNGLMIAEDKVKLDNIEENANNYVHPTYTSKASGLYKVTVDGTGHINATAAVTKADITALGIPAQDTVYTHPDTHAATMITEDTTHRFVTDTEKATWNAKASTAVATQTANGLMSSGDKLKLDNIDEGANKTVVDTALSSTSTNPVQNKVINTALSGKAPTTHNHTKAQITDFPSSLPASDVSAWAKAATKPTYTASEVGADASGAAAQALTDANKYTDTKVADLINSAPETLDTLGEIATAMEENASVVDALNDAIGTKANSSTLTAHTGNTTVHITSAERTKWNAAQANQNAFSNFLVGSTTIAADAVSDTLELKGSNVTLTPDATNDAITIGITKANVTTALGYTPPTKDTVYTHPAYTARAAGLNKVTVDAQGHVSAVSAITKADITGLGIPAQDTTYSLATTSANGLMASTDKSNINSLLSRVSTLETNYNNMLAKLKTAVFYSE